MANPVNSTRVCCLPGEWHTHDPKDPLKPLDNIDNTHASAHDAISTRRAYLPHLQTQPLLENIRHPKARSTWAHMMSHCRELVLSNQSCEVKKTLQAEIAHGVATHINSKPDSILHPLEIEDAVATDLEADVAQMAACRGSLVSMKKLHHYIQRAMVTAFDLSGRSAVSDEIRGRVNEYQHRAFLNNIPWENVADQVQEEILHDLHELDMPDKVKQTLESEVVRQVNADPGYRLSADGGRFESYKNTVLQRAEGTQIRCQDGRVFELINKPSKKQWEDVVAQKAPQGENGILNDGMLGKVRLAKDLSSGEIVVVKKIRDRASAEREIENLIAATGSSRLTQMVGYSHTVGKDGKEKAYLFIPVAGGQDAFDYFLELGDLRETMDPLVAEQLTREVAQACLEAACELHALNLAHHDIKPENIFLNSPEDLKLGDLAMASASECEFTGGSIGYISPESMVDASLYRGRPHDDFAMGMTLLFLKHGDPGYFVEHDHLILNGQGVTLRFSNHPEPDRRYCLGLPCEFAGCPGNTLDEVIARLLVAHPEHRISIEDALQLPYFQNDIQSVETAVDQRVVPHHHAHLERHINRLPTNEYHQARRHSN